MRLSLIVAMAANRVIGRDNRLPWHLSADLKRFKRLTMGHTLIMGRKTFESIGRPLPGRSTVVVTRRTDYAPPGVQVAHSVREALALTQGDEEVFIAGGAELFRETLPVADRLYLTLIEKEFEGDTFFPDFDPSAWRVVEEERHEPDAEVPYAYTFQTLDR
ncbi:MAG TPA: dihydrofolate reductase [Thermoanaerobaculia bacterium]|nr:dihydrofolate reductase [Thermoanaerobaculia bacterium]